MKPFLQPSSDGVDLRHLIVSSTLVQLDNLRRGDHYAFHQLVMHARDPGYAMTAEFSSAAYRLGLLEAGGSMHSVVRAAILEHVEGDGHALAIRRAAGLGCTP